jgi:prefoldin subunit 5
MPGEDLHEPLRSVNKAIARLREDVATLTGEVKKIPEAITQAANTIRDAIQENIQAQAELKLMEHVMEVRSVKPQIEAERDQIETERAELDERLESIGDRYREQQAELDEKASERVRELGSHIFEIDEREFEDGIEDPFTGQVTAAWQSLQAHNASVGEERTSAVRERTGEVVQTIHDYVDRQEQLVESIREHRLDEDDLPVDTGDAEPLQVPYYVVEYEVDGVTKRQTVVPSRLDTEGTEWCGVSTTPIDGAEDLVGGATPSADGATAMLRGETLRRSLEDYGDSSPLGLSYLDAVEAALPDDGDVPVTLQGGDA